MEEFQDKIRTIIYAIFAGIVGVVLIRVLLKLIGANPDNEFTDFWYQFSDVFVSPWQGIYPNIVSGRMVIEIYSIISAIFYLLLSFVVSKSVTSPLENTFKQAILAIVDALFKITEFLLITRFVFKLTAASTAAPFVRFIYDVSWVVYEPFATIMPSVKFEDAQFEISTLIALIIVIILDAITESLVSSLIDAILPPKKIKKTTIIAEPALVQQPVQQVQQNPLPPAQHININLPPNYTNPQYPPAYTQQPRRVINVTQNPKPPVQKKRGFLEHFTKPRSSRQGGPANS